MDRKLLAVYMNDHLAGSAIGKSLARRIAQQNEGNDYGREVAEIAREIEDDQATLLEVMRRAGVRRTRIRLVFARLTELATRLKPNGRLFGYSPLSRVLELEGLTMGITGKLELWRSLQAVQTDPPRYPTPITAGWRSARRVSATASRSSTSGRPPRPSATSALILRSSGPR